MNDFIYYSPTKFVFGRDVVEQVGAEMAALSLKKVMIVYGKGSVVRTGLLDRVKASLDQAGVAFVEAGGVRPNPEVNWVRDAIAVARAEGVEGMLAVGGGSVIDAAKATAFGVPYEGDVWDFFGKKQPIRECLPVAAVLTIPARYSHYTYICIINK